MPMHVLQLLVCLSCSQAFVFAISLIRSAPFLQVIVDYWTDHILVGANYALLSGETEGYCKLESLKLNLHIL